MRILSYGYLSLEAGQNCQIGKEDDGEYNQGAKGTWSVILTIAIMGKKLCRQKKNVSAQTLNVTASLNC